MSALPAVVFSLVPVFDFQPSLLDPLSVVLLLGACVGHTFFLVVSLNVLYGWPLPHKVLKLTRKIDVLLVLAGPVFFWFAMGFSGPGLSWELGQGYLLIPYVVFCWVLGFGVAPAAMILYHLRRPPAELLSNDTDTLDVAKELGYKPVGKGNYRKLATLPFNQCFQVDFVERALRLPRLPLALDGLTILHVSDLHLSGTPDKAFYYKVFERCLKDALPDIVAVTGDIVETDWHYRWIVPILGRLRWTAAGLAILGNHDAWRDTSLIRKRLRRAGYRVLGNTWEKIEVRGEPVVVIGHEGPWFTPEPDLSDCPADHFRLCLSHTPDNIAWAKRHRIDLMLSGHVHGGQIRFPLIGSVFVPSRYSRRYDSGTFFEPPTLLHVSRGLAGQHPLRFNCRPEVTRLILRRG